MTFLDRIILTAFLANLVAMVAYPLFAPTPAIASTQEVLQEEANVADPADDPVWTFQGIHRYGYGSTPIVIEDLSEGTCLHFLHGMNGPDNEGFRVPEAGHAIGIGCFNTMNGVIIAPGL